MKPDRNITKLNTESLTVGYHGVPLIRDIALSLKKGEILTLIGPNGGGKTTILKTITNHLASLSGAVYLDGKDMRALNRKDIATKLAVVLTERARPDLTTCYDLVAAGRYPYTGSFGLLTKRDREIVENSLRRVHALDIADKDISEISDGQRQRVLLARALCQEPEVIVLDEPTAFLDIRHKIELLGILSDMAKTQGIAVVMSLHEIDLAQRVSDRIVCVKGEHIAACGTPEEIFSGDTVASLYDIDSGSFNALLGCVELSAPNGAIKAFVIGGCGKGITYCRALQKRNLAFAAGILAENDIDTVVARPLAKKLIVSEPFMPAKQEQIDEAKRIIDSVGYVIDCGAPVREYNHYNKELIEYAKKAGKHIIRSLSELREAEL